MLMAARLYNVGAAAGVVGTTTSVPTNVGRAGAVAATAAMAVAAAL